MIETTAKRAMCKLSCTAAIVLWSSLCFAQNPGKVFAERGVSKEALINALEPSRPGDVQTRSIKLQANTPEHERPKRTLSRSSAASGGANASSGQASLLITFPTNSSELSGQAKKALGIVAQALTSDRLANLKFDVEGHADPRGDEQLNEQLSQARAQSVVAFLSSEHNIPMDRLQPIGKGSKALANPDSPTAAVNRRVTFRTVVSAQ